MNENEIDQIYDLRFNINYYGADYPIDALVKRMEEEEFIIPKFQREYVWKSDEASKFIESLLLGLPVPSIFLAKDKFSNKLIVVDGQQRLRTLQYFYRGRLSDGKIFKLRNISEQFNGLTYEQLSSEDKRNLGNTIIHCIIIAENEDSNSIFYLFERLNTTGTALNSQEIRNALYHGDFTDLLRHLSSSEIWKKLRKKDNTRLEDEELILRFFAFHFSIALYSGNLNQFLNDFMLRNRTLKEIPENQFIQTFDNTFGIIAECIGESAFNYQNKFSRVLYESLSLIIAQNIDNADCEIVKNFHTNLISDKKFWILSKSSTTSTKNVLSRLKLAQEIFSK